MAYISILEAAAKYGKPAYRFHRWIHAGHLKRMAKVEGKGRGGDVLLDADAVAALIANPPKMGRPASPILAVERENKIAAMIQRRSKAAEQRKARPCTICGFVRFVERAHIIPAVNGGKTESDNLLWLCANHHRLFERYLLTESEIELLPIVAKQAYLDRTTAPANPYIGRQRPLKLILPQALTDLTSGRK